VNPDDAFLEEKYQQTASRSDEKREECLHHLAYEDAFFYALQDVLSFHHASCDACSWGRLSLARPSPLPEYQFSLLWVIIIQRDTREIFLSVREFRRRSSPKSFSRRFSSMQASPAYLMKTMRERIINVFRPSSVSLLFFMAVVVGLGTGFGAVFFIKLIEWTEYFFYTTLSKVAPSLGRGWFIIVPVLGGLIAGPIIAFFAKEAKGHGVPEVMEAIALRGGRIRPRVVVAKVVASASCIGTGGSAGREGPIVQVGAALGSTLAQWLHFSESRIRNLVACGAAAGIAATFNAPMAGVVFAIEIILGELAMADLSSVILSAITASTVARFFLGNDPAFKIPLYEVRNPLEIFLYLALGVLGAVVGVLFIRSLYWFEDIFDEWKFPDFLKPAVGGLLLGVMGYLYPQILGLGFVPREELRLGIIPSENIPHVFGAGFPIIELTLLGKVSIGLLLTLIFLKILATSLTLGSGNSGGVFAPALFMGAMVGGSFGWLTEQIFPSLSAGTGAYAIVGMAAVFAAAARAPLTAILIVFEMTDDYRILLPLMGAVIISTIVAQQWQPESIYTLKLVKRGIRLFRGRDIDVMAAVTVEEVMDKNPVTVSLHMPLSELVQVFAKTNSHGFPVLDEDGKLWGIVSLSDLRRACPVENSVPENLTVRDIANPNIVIAYPDERLSDIIPRMAPRDLSRVPVVSREDHRELLGILRRQNIIRAYEIGVVRRGFAVGSLPGAPEGTATGEFPITADSIFVDKKISELNIPEPFLVIHIRRSGRMILPHGDTRLQEGDIVTVLTRDGDQTELEKFWLQKRPPPEDTEEEGKEEEEAESESPSSEDESAA
jgi:CIC family chloride channel protein